MQNAADDLAMLRFSLFGTPSVETPTSCVNAFRSHRVPALFGLLVSRPGLHLRDEVSDLLWPAMEPQRARHNLRQTLVYLREVLGGDSGQVLEVDRSHVGLTVGSYELGSGTLPT